MAFRAYTNERTHAFMERYRLKANETREKGSSREEKVGKMEASEKKQKQENK